MIFIWINSQDPLYEPWSALRLRILREPLGLSFSAEDIAAEADEKMLLVLLDGEIAGGLNVIEKTVDDALVWKIRQVAVDEALQRRSYGQRLMAEAERAGLEAGVARLILHARETVVSFYERIGYRCEGDTFYEVGIPHRKMVKKVGTEV